MFLSKIKIKCNQITSVRGFGSWLEGGGDSPDSTRELCVENGHEIGGCVGATAIVWHRSRIRHFKSRSPDVTNMAVFWSKNKAPKTIVVNGNHLEFCQYFSIYCKTRYLIHLTICNEHILTTSDQNCNLIAYIMDSFDSFFHLF